MNIFYAAIDFAILIFCSLFFNIITYCKGIIQILHNAVFGENVARLVMIHNANNMPAPFVT